MNKILFFTTFFMFPIALAFLCPEGSIESSQDPNLCYWFISEELEFFNAEMACQNLNGHLASIHNMYDNVLILEKAATTFAETTLNKFWIGGTSALLSEDYIWKWTDNSPFDFIMTFSNPSNAQIIGKSIGVEIRGGKWAALDSFDKLPFVCGIKKTAPIGHCSLGWIYYRPKHSCYGITYRGQKHPIVSTWNEANDYCRNSGGNLPSFHDLNEFNVLQAFIIPAIQPIWIGLKSNDNGKKWSWSDGSVVDYLPPWQKGNYKFPASLNDNTIKCVMANIGVIEKHDCDSTRAWVICKQPAVGNAFC